MTRARYFLFVPWIYRRLEYLRVGSAEIAARGRRAELSLVQPIEDSDDNDGNIGKLAKTTLKRLPSNVYWQGLAVWGIRCFSGAQVQYHRSLDYYYSQLRRHGSRLPERDTEHDDLVLPNWHAGLIDPPADFPQKCSLRLSRTEAEYLAERIRLSPACAGSLLAELAAQKQRNVQVAFPWEHPCAANLPTRLREILNHAHNFSEVMHGAALLYNLVLAEQARWKDRVGQYRHSLTEWVDTILKRARVLAQWDKERFWEIVWAVNPRITKPTYDFINTWWTFSLGAGAAQVADNAAARLLIGERERQLKKSLARINNPRAQELWTGSSGTAQLEFRWNISQKLLRDIFDGLEATGASA